MASPAFAVLAFFSLSNNIERNNSLIRTFRSLAAAHDDAIGWQFLPGAAWRACDEAGACWLGRAGGRRQKRSS